VSTKKPRITITLEREHHALLARVAELQARSMSSVVSELVATIAPSLGRVCTLLERASGANRELLAGLVAGVEKAESAVRGAAAAPASAPEARRRDPRPVNTGVRSGGPGEGRERRRRVSQAKPSRGGA
jgi:hypothetical protein